MFGANAPVTPLLGSEQVGDKSQGPTSQPPVAAPQAVQPQAPQAPPIVSGGFTPETFESPTPMRGEEGGGGPAQALSPGPLTAGANSEFARTR
jgi:hypothetical protein